MAYFHQVPVQTGKDLDIKKNRIDNTFPSIVRKWSSKLIEHTLRV